MGENTRIHAGVATGRGTRLRSCRKEQTISVLSLLSLPVPPSPAIFPSSGRIPLGHSCLRSSVLPSGAPWRRHKLSGRAEAAHSYVACVCSTDRLHNLPVSMKAFIFYFIKVYQVNFINLTRKGLIKPGKVFPEVQSDTFPSVVHPPSIQQALRANCVCSALC